MADIKIIKAETEEELDTFQDMTTYAFAPSPVLERDTSKRKYQETSSRYLLYEDDTAVSSLNSIPMTQNVRETIFSMQGIAGVSSYPEGRRKGYVKKLMQHALEVAYDTNIPFSTLYPFRESFYSKFGYITFPQAREAVFKPAHLRDVENYPTQGTYERFPIGVCIDRYYTFLQKIQERQHGLGLFNRETEQRHEQSKYWVVFGMIGGEDQAMMIYSTKGFEKEMKINALFYLNSEAKYLMLNYLSLHVDQFSEIQLRVFADEYPERWLLDTKMTIKSRDWVPSAMGRIVDISKIENIKVGEGDLTVNISDPYCDWNNRSWRFYSSEEKLQVEEVEHGEIDMSIQGLSALVYGWYHIDDLHLRNWLKGEDYTPQLQELFPQRIPVLFSIF